MNRSLHFMLVTLIFFGCSAMAQKPAQKEIMASKETAVITAEVSYFKGNTRIKGYLARPNDGQKHPGLILIPENVITKV